MGVYLHIQKAAGLQPIHRILRKANGRGEFQQIESVVCIDMHA